MNLKMRSMVFEDSLFEECYFEDITSSNTFFKNCTFIATLFYNTGEQAAAPWRRLRRCARALPPRHVLPGESSLDPPILLRNADVSPPSRCVEKTEEMSESGDSCVALLRFPIVQQ